MSEFFHEGSRKLQDRFETRPMADRLVEAIITDQISPEDKTFIEEQNMFFFATVDREGRPSCSYKGGSVRFGQSYRRTNPGFSALRRQRHVHVGRQCLG